MLISGQVPVVFDVKVFDNCTGELLGTTPLESGFVMLPNPDAAQREAVRMAIEKGMVRVLYLFNESMGSWINEGAPYRVRIYNATSPALTSRDMRQFKNKLTSNSDFGGTFEPNLNNGYFLYNISYKKRSDQMSDLLMDYADETEALKSLKMDVSFQFGRFICFTPSAQKDAVKPLQDLDKVQEAIEKKQSTNDETPLDLEKILQKTKAVKPQQLAKPDFMGTSKPTQTTKKTTTKTSKPKKK